MIIAVTVKTTENRKTQLIILWMECVPGTSFILWVINEIRFSFFSLINGNRIKRNKSMRFFFPSFQPHMLIWNSFRRLFGVELFFVHYSFVPDIHRNAFQVLSKKIYRFLQFDIPAKFHSIWGRFGKQQQYMAQNPIQPTMHDSKPGVKFGYLTTKSMIQFELSPNFWLKSFRIFENKQIRFVQAWNQSLITLPIC